MQPAIIPKPSLVNSYPDGKYELLFVCPTCKTAQENGIRANYCYHCGAHLDWTPIKASSHLTLSPKGTIYLDGNLSDIYKAMPLREHQVFLLRLETELNTGVSLF